MADQRPYVAHRLAEQLVVMQGEADAHDSRALASRAALRRSVNGTFGFDSKADAELLRLIPLVPVDGELPELDAALGRTLDDASLVAGLVAATRVRVHVPTGPDGEPRPWYSRSFGRDLRAIAVPRERISHSLLSTLLRSDREQLPRPLRRALTLMADDGAPFDAYSLMMDLGWWNADDARVQKRWAYHFWSSTDAFNPDPEKKVA